MISEEPTSWNPFPFTNDPKDWWLSQSDVIFHVLKAGFKKTLIMLMASNRPLLRENRQTGLPIALPIALSNPLSILPLQADYLGFNGRASVPVVSSNTTSSTSLTNSLKIVRLPHIHQHLRSSLHAYLECISTCSLPNQQTWFRHH